MEPWVARFEERAKEKIRENEAWLAKFGIMPASGVEQEFYIRPQHDAAGQPITAPFDVNHVFDEFGNSPSVEAFVKEKSTYAYEIIVGRGQGRNEKPYPHESLKPSHIVRATDAARRLIEKRSTDPKYHIRGITFDCTTSPRGGGLASQQSNISLWGGDKSPLFMNPSPGGKKEINGLTESCLKSLLEAQHEMGALVMTSPHTFNRLTNRGVNQPHSIKWGENKFSGGTVSLRVTDKDKSATPSYYFENRLPDSDESPSLNLLLTTSAVVEGVKKYMAKHHIDTKEAWERHLKSPEFSAARPLSDIVMPEYDLPLSHREALGNFRDSAMAKRILGEDFHKDLCDGFREHCADNRRSAATGAGR